MKYVKNAHGVRARTPVHIQSLKDSLASLCYIWDKTSLLRTFRGSIVTENQFLTTTKNVKKMHGVRACTPVYFQSFSIKNLWLLFAIFWIEQVHFEHLEGSIMTEKLFLDALASLAFKLSVSQSVSHCFFFPDLQSIQSFSHFSLLSKTNFL